MNRLSLTLSALLFAYGSFAQAPHYPTIGQVVRLDPRFDKLVPANAKIEVLASGFVWAEGPVWVKDGTGGYLLFSDVPENTIHKWTEKEGVTTFLKPAGYTGRLPYGNEPGSNGLTLDHQGRLIICEHGDRRVSALPLTTPGGKKTLADTYQGKRFNSPNDVVAHANGGYYFTDPPYGMPQKENDPTRETPVFGVYYINPTGQVSLVISDLTRPNGVALSPDEKTLYVAQSDMTRPIIMSYTIQPDGSLTNGRIFFDTTPLVNQKLVGAPDGLKVDRDGNIWSTGPGGVLVIGADGKLLGRIDPGEATANCGWGDDGSTLYLTADMYLCRIRTTAKGAY